MTRIYITVQDFDLRYSARGHFDRLFSVDYEPDVENFSSRHEFLKTGPKKKTVSGHF